MLKSMHEVPFEVVRVGVVSSIDRKKATARVYFEDREDAVSYDLKVISLQSMKTKYHWMPDVDETVICLFLPNGQESGYILGSVYSEVDKVPAEIEALDVDRDGVWFEDGTVVKYELDTKTLVVDCVGDIRIKAAGNIYMKATNIYFD